MNALCVHDFVRFVKPHLILPRQGRGIAYERQIGNIDSFVRAPILIRSPFAPGQNAICDSPARQGEVAGTACRRGRVAISRRIKPFF
jgi:hypothetical protein